MKDRLERELVVGDYVIYIVPNYRQLGLGKIVSFTPQNVRIEIPRLRSNDFGKYLLQSPDQLVKIDGPDLTVFFLKNI